MAIIPINFGGGIDLDFITAEGQHILKNKVGANQDGDPVIGAMPDNGTLYRTITPTTSSQSIAINSGYYSGGTVSIGAIPSKYTTQFYEQKTLSGVAGNTRFSGMAWNGNPPGNSDYVSYKFPDNVTPIGLYFMSNRANNDLNHDRHFGYIWASGSPRIYSCMNAAVYSSDNTMGWINGTTYCIPLNQSGSAYYIVAIGIRK